MARFVADLTIAIALGRLFGHDAGAAVVLAEAVGARFVLGLAHLGLDALLLRAIGRQLFTALDALPKRGGPTAVDDRVSSLFVRDATRLIEGVRAVVDLATVSGSIVIVIAVVIARSGLLGVAGVSAVAAFLPLSVFIGRRRAGLAADIFRASTDRIDGVARWVALQPTLASWRVGALAVGRLGRLARAEVALRDRDSIWRGLDLYSMAFGKVVPIAATLGLGLLFALAAGADATGLWIALLFVNQLLRSGRSWPLLAEAQAALRAIATLFAGRPDTEIVFDESWALWEGSLLDNVLGEDGADLLARVGLSLELDRPLARGGRDVSAGEQERILLVRALNAWRAEPQARLVIRHGFASLDPRSAQAVLELLDELEAASSRLVVAATTREHLAWQAVRPSAPAPTHAAREAVAAAGGAPIAPRASVLSVWRDLARPVALTMIVPVVLLAATGSIAGASAPTWMVAAILLLAGAAGVALATGIGRAVEGGIRRWAISRFEVHAERPLARAADALQRLTADCSTVCGRIAWYTHDLVWLALLFVVTATSIAWTSGLVGGAILAVVSLLWIGIWRYASTAVRRARHRFTEGTNLALESAGDALAIRSGQLLPRGAAASRRFAHAAVDRFFQATLELDLARGHALNLASLASGASVIVAGVAAAAGSSGGEALAFLGTALLNADLRASVLFAALTGFEGQRVSVERLAAPASPAGRREPLRAREHRFCPGVTAIDAVSGAGKTLYLRALASASSDVVYCDGATRDALAWLRSPSPPEDFAGELLRFCRERWSEGARLIALDEALVPLPADRALELLRQLDEEATARGRVVVVVDHRVRLERSLPLSSILGAA